MSPEEINRIANDPRAIFDFLFTCIRAGLFTFDDLKKMGEKTHTTDLSTFEEIAAPAWANWSEDNIEEDEL